MILGQEKEFVSNFLFYYNKVVNKFPNPTKAPFTFLV